MDEFDTARTIREAELRKQAAENVAEGQISSANDDTAAVTHYGTPLKEDLRKSRSSEQTQTAAELTGSEGESSSAARPRAQVETEQQDAAHRMAASQDPGPAPISTASGREGYIPSPTAPDPAGVAPVPPAPGAVAAPEVAPAIPQRTAGPQDLSAEARAPDGPVNQAPTDIVVEGGAVSETATGGTVVATLGALDPDLGDGHSFSLQLPGGGQAPFEVVGNQLVLRDGAELDYETAPQIDLEITATDEAGLTVTRTVTIDVTDVNEAPVLQPDLAPVAENTAGAVIGDLGISDPDIGDSAVITLSDDRFEVVDGKLKLRDDVALDHESEPVVRLDVTVTDAGGLSHEQTLNIDVADVNEAPSAVTFTPDVTGARDTAHLSVRLGGEAFRGDPHYEIFVDGKKVAAGRVDWARDTEADGLYGGTSQDLSDEVVWKDIELDVPRDGDGIGTVEVRFPNDKYRRGVGDRNLLVDRIELDGEVIEAESADVDYTSSKFADGGSGERMPWAGKLVFDTSGITPDTMPLVTEGREGAHVGRIDVADPDAGEQFSYSVSDARFEVQDGVLKLRDDVALDSAQDGLLDLTVEVTDAGGHTITQEVHLGVVTPEDAPPPVAVETGFRVEFFDFDGPARSLADVDFSAPPDHVAVHQEIDFARTRGSFWEDGARDTFAARVTGSFEVTEEGLHHFRMTSDDGSVLLIDGEPVIDHDGLHVMRTDTGEITLEPGHHEVEIRYFENRGVAGLELDMSPPGSDAFHPLTASADMTAAPGTSLPISVSVPDGASVDALFVEGLPEGAVLASGNDVAIARDGSADVSGWNLDCLDITPPPGFEGQMSLAIRAQGVNANALAYETTQQVTLTVEESPAVDHLPGEPADMLGDMPDAPEAWVDFAGDTPLAEGIAEAGFDLDDAVVEPVAAFGEEQALALDRCDI